MKKINPIFIILVVIVFLLPVAYLLYKIDNSKQTILNTSISSSNTNTNQLALTILDGLKTKEYGKLDFLHCKSDDNLEDQEYEKYLNDFKTKIKDYNFENSKILSVKDIEILISGGKKLNSELVSESLLFKVEDQKFSPGSTKSTIYKCFMVDTNWK